MEAFNVRELKRSDASALLAFEVRNRAWFESQIDPRAPSFYSSQGVADHIEVYLSGFAEGRWHPFVIEDASGNIVGRANLKDIDTATGAAEVGYRIDQHVIGRGLATQALRHLVETARAHWGLRQLVAWVYAQNVGSQKVLERCGFLPDGPPGAEASAHEWRFVLAI